MPSRGKVSWAPDGPEQVAKKGVSISLQIGDETTALDSIRGITAGLRNVDQTLRELVHEARARGHSWQEIADALGVSRQSAWQRFATSEESERARVVAEIAGSLGPWPPDAPTLEEIRESERDAAAEREERRWGSNPPGIKWRS